MGRYTLKIGMAISDSSLDFLDSNDFLRWSSENTIREVVWQAQAKAARESLKRKNNPTPTKKEIRLEKSKEFKGKYYETKMNVLKDSWNSAGIRTESDGFRDIEIKTKKDNRGGVPQKIKILSTFFYRIVCRTPYDEDYYYKGYSLKNSVVKTKNIYTETKKSNGLIVRTITGTDTYTTKKRQHTADTDSVKKDWVLKINSRNPKKVISISVRDLMDNGGYKFESISDLDELKKFARYVASKTKDFDEAYPMNTNPRVAQLEYGKYKKKEEGEFTANKGPNRYHGSVEGYSVQAPRGFVRLTEQELNEMSSSVQSNSNLEDGYDMPQSSVLYKSEYAISFNLESYLKNKSFDLKYLFDEKDIIAACKHRGKNSDASVSIPTMKISQLEAYIRKGFQECMLVVENNAKVAAKKNASSNSGKKTKSSKLSLDVPGLKYSRNLEDSMSKAKKAIEDEYIYDGFIYFTDKNKNKVAIPAYIEYKGKGKCEMFVDISSSHFNKTGQKYEFPADDKEYIKGHLKGFKSVNDKDVIDFFTEEYISSLINSFKGLDDSTI